MLARLAGTLSFILNHPLNQKRRALAVWRFLKWQVSSRLSASQAVDFVEDTKMVVSRGMTGATGNVYCGLHEFEDMAFTLHVLRPGDLFVDVGANIGSYSLLASTAGADVIAFEPGERIDDLRRNAAVNGFPMDIRNEAVGATAGILRFTTGRDSMNRFAQAEEVANDTRVTTLDEAIPRPPTLIKVDVEGFEGAVLAGGRRTFGTAQALLLELVGQGARFGFDEAEIECQILGMGFRRVSYDPWGRKLEPSHRAGNALFVKEGLAERLQASRKYRVHGHLI